MSPLRGRQPGKGTLRAVQAMRKARQGSALGFQLKVCFALLTLPLAAPLMSPLAKQDQRSCDATLRHVTTSPVLLGEEEK